MCSLQGHSHSHSHIAGCTVERSTTNTGECQQGGQECVNECPDVSKNLIQIQIQNKECVNECPDVSKPSLSSFLLIAKFSFFASIRILLWPSWPANIRTREARIVVEEEENPLAPPSLRRSARPGTFYLRGVPGYQDTWHPYTRIPGYLDDT